MRVLKFEDLEEKMIKYLKEDIKLYSIGFSPIDNHYKFLPSGVTDITGYPYSGKTLIANEILFNLTKKHGIRHLLHLPDAGKPEEVISHLIQKETGKTFDKRYQNLIQESEVSPALYRIVEKFNILELEKDRKGRLQRPTPKEFWEYAIENNYSTATIDSWNYMNHVETGPGYLADVLSYRNELADLHKIHFFTIIHPSKPTKENFNAQGNLKPPDIYDLMGGSEWANNARNVISIHKEEKEGIEYDIYFQKIKPRIVGKTGMITLEFDIKLQKFYYPDFGKRVYAFDQMEDIETIQPDGGMSNKFEDHENNIEQITDPENSDLPF